MDKKSCRKTTIGGQALLEGIMMKGPKKTSVVIRKSDGTHIVRVEELRQLKDKYPILGLPFIRGFVGFIEMMVTGMRFLTFSANEYDGENADMEPTKFDLWLEKKLGAERAEKLIMGIAITLGILFPIALFILLPTLLAGFFESIAGSGFLRNLLEGALRIILFIGFLFSVSRLKDMRRVFSYHGAEHKSIACYEAGEELTVENVRRFSRFHPRCGTSFLFVVMIVSILVYSVFSWSNPFMRLLVRLALFPVIVAISYEVNRFAGRYDNFLTIAVRSPGLALQRLTTNEPDDDMISVAIDALERVIPEDDSDKW